MRKLLHIFVTVACLAATSGADDLYKVTLHSNTQAQLLISTGAEPLVWVGGGYLILADDNASAQIRQSELDAHLITSDIRRDQLALDGRKDRKNVDRYELLYEEEGVRLFLIEAGGLSQANRPTELYPLYNEHLEIQYHPKVLPTRVSSAPLDEISDLLDLVSTDSAWSYVEALQAFPDRVAGTASNRDSRDWIAAKFAGYGYDSVYIDSFDTYFYEAYNVVATKPGTLFPEQQIVVGGHFDAVSGSPGADDNASGTAGTMEIARVLKDIDLPITLIFIAFDAEETGLTGSDHYAEEAYANGDDIVFMMNMDMIGYIGNSDAASLYYGPEMAYALLWDEMGRTYTGISGVFAGTSGRSDHYPFQQMDYDVCFCIENVFSSVYHSSRDSTTYMSPDYFTRMVKTSLATVYKTSFMPQPVRIVSIMQEGDGQSLEVTWEDVECADRDHYSLGYYPTDNPGAIQYITVPETDTVYIVDGLTEGLEYAFFVQVYDTYGMSSIAFYRETFATPSSIPAAPTNLLARPLFEGIQVSWSSDNFELDFDHFEIFRDGQSIGQTTDTIFEDHDPTLGTDFHSYKVKSVDSQGDYSDTVGIEPVETKAATLQADRILAVNRTQFGRGFDLVDHNVTGEFLLEALAGYNFDYYADTFAVVWPFIEPQLDLVDLIDYGLVIVGMETGRFDDLARDSLHNGLLDTLAYYTSIGGKAIIFGRWGTLYLYDTVDYLDNYYDYDDAYHDAFHIDTRVLTYSNRLPDTILADLVGAISTNSDYQSLMWDSLTTLLHSSHSIEGGLTFTQVTGIPCVSYVTQTARPGLEILYTYNSRNDNPNNEGQPVAWRYLGDDYQYVYFDIPLSFFDRSDAITALRQAVTDLTGGSTLPPDNDENEEPVSLPNSYALYQNYPNPFNPTTRIDYDLPQPGHVKLTIYNLLGQKVRVLVDEFQQAGQQFVEWDGRLESDDRVASGLYLYRLQAGDIDDTKKMLLLK